VKSWRYALAAVAGLLGAAAALPWPSWLYVVIYESAVVLAAGLAWSAVPRIPREDRLPWALVALAITLWGIGDTVWDAITLSGSDADVSVADAIYLTGYLVLAGAVLHLLRPRSTGRREALLDGSALACAVAVVLWLTLARPSSEDHDWLAAVVLAGYPLMDAVLVAALLWLVLTPGGNVRASRLLVGGLVAMTVVDTAYAAFGRAGWDDAAAYSGAAYPAVYALMALSVGQAAVVPTAQAPPRSSSHLHPGRAVLLGAALLLAPLAGAFSATGGASVDRVVVVVVTCAISIMVLVRFVNEAHARESLHDEAIYLASHDPLTGLTNRRAFVQELDRQLGRRSCALIYIDLDGFKWLNDSGGHDAGDDALVKVARRLLDAVRDVDVVARIGGDEFAVCCPDLTDLTAAEQLAERVRASLERVHPSLTASVGVAVGASGRGTAPELLTKADAAMYRAKRSGGNRTWADIGAPA
jgi:diguanylate cyclase (GGDEF)-like protein